MLMPWRVDFFMRRPKRGRAIHCSMAYVSRYGFWRQYLLPLRMVRVPYRLDDGCARGVLS
jgi:hypothetical protein